jgi:PAS domain S-box-containing protein
MSKKDQKSQTSDPNSFYQEIVECIEEGIWKVDSFGRTEFVNQRIADMLGYSRSELMGRSLFDFVPSEEKQNTKKSVGSSDSAFCIQRRFIRNDGKILWFRVTSSPSFGPGGEFRGRIGVIVDISSEKETQDERDKFFSESLDMLGIAGTDTFFKRLNPAFEKTLGWSIEELLSKSYLEFVHPDDLKATNPAAERIKDGLAITSFENRYRCKDGTYRWLSWKSSSAQNGMTYFVARDVTEQKQLQNALKAAAEMQAVLTDLGQLALKSSELQIVFERAVNLCAQTLQIEFCSITELLPGGEDMHAIAGAGWAGSACSQGEHAPITLSINSHIVWALENREPVVVENFATEERFQSSELLKSAGITSGIAVAIAGSERPFGVLSTHSRSKRSFIREEVNFLNAISHILSTAVERRKLEGQLKTSDRMASVGILAAGVAHEINNPLSYVITNLDLLSSGLLLEEDLMANRTSLLHMVTQAQEGAERVRQVVKDLKTFSGNSDDRLGPVDLQKVIEFGLRMASNHLKYRAKVTTNFRSAPPALANENRLGQVVLNILVNAAQAIPEGHVQKNEVTVLLDTDISGRAVIEISDTGIGIPADILPRIFDPFFTTKPIGVGTGLGLSICRSIILKLNGELSIESRVGFGTQVRITLPPAEVRARFSSSTVAVSIDATDARARCKILIVDDEALLIESLGKALAHAHDVQTTTSPKEALRLIVEKQIVFDVIFCDLMMAELTGMAFFEELKGMKPGFEERVIFMTGGAFTFEARKFLEKVSNARIEKPFNLKDIRELLASQSITKESRN